MRWDLSLSLFASPEILPLGDLYGTVQCCACLNAIEFNLLREVREGNNLRLHYVPTTVLGYLHMLKPLIVLFSLSPVAGEENEVERGLYRVVQ